MYGGMLSAMGNKDNQIMVSNYKIINKLISRKYGRRKTRQR
jgi:hypothetical protein